MKQIFSYLIPYRARMALGFSIKVAATIVELLIPWALSIMVDKVIPTENIGFVFAWGGVMILFAILALLGNIVANRMASLVARNTTERIRLQLFSKISFLSARQQEQIGQASLISRSTSDTYNIHQFIGMMQRLGVRQPIMLIGGLAVTLSMLKLTVGIPAAVETILGMVGQQQLIQYLSGSQHLGRMGSYDHSLPYLSHAGGLKVLHSLHFHNTDTAGAVLMDILHMAQTGNPDSRCLSRFHNGGAL